MSMVTTGDSGSLDESDQTQLFLRWQGVEHPIDRLDEFTFVVNSSVLAKLHAESGVPTVHDGEIRGVDEIVEIQFRIRETDNDCALCGFSDLAISTRDRLSMLAERSRSPQKDALQSLSYDELALGNTDKREVTKPAPSKDSSTLKKAIVSMVLVASMLVIVSWVLMVVRSQSTIAVSNSVMVGNYQAVNTPLEGKLLDLKVAIGDRVEAGQVLATVANPEVGYEMRIVDTQITKAERDLITYQQRIVEIKAMLVFARQSLQTKRQVAAAVKSRIRGDLRVAKAQLKRQKWLMRKGLAKIEKYEEAKALKDRWTAELVGQDAVIAGIELAEKAAAKNVIVNEARISNPLSEIRTKIALAESRVGELKETRQLFAEKARPVDLIAPSSGTIYAIYRQPGEVLKHADEAIAISRDGRSWASGHISPEMAANIKPGQLVEIEIPSYELTTTGIVEGIGHRAVHGRGGYTADFRGGPLDVPIRVAINPASRPIPSGLRLNMTIRVRDHVKEMRTWMDGLMVRLFPGENALEPSAKEVGVKVAALKLAKIPAKVHVVKAKSKTTKAEKSKLQTPKNEQSEIQAPKREITKLGKAEPVKIKIVASSRGAMNKRQSTRRYVIPK